jgi:phosphinothricin acetyltransferase
VIGVVKNITISIREMTPEDWCNVAEIYWQGILTGNATLESAVPAYEAWNAAHAQKCRLVAVADGEAVGWAALSPVSLRRVYAGVAEVSVYISEKRRRQKIGQKLLNTLIEESEKEGYWTLQSSISTDNFPSVALHHKCGFRTVGVRERLGRDPKGRWRDILLLEYRSAKIGID